MAVALTPHLEAFIDRMVRSGRYNNRSEVVREALRRLESQENGYLNPPPLTEAGAQRLFETPSAWDKVEAAAVKASRRAMRSHGRKRVEEL